jgi:hypothetical protein
MLRGLSLLAASEASAAVKRSLHVAAIIAAAVVAALAAAGFALVALQAWLSQRMTPIEASLVVAGGLLALAIIMVIAAAVVRRRRRQSSPLATAALVIAPTAARVAMRRLDVATIGMAAVVAIGAYVGRKIAKG